MPLKHTTDSRYRESEQAHDHDHDNAASLSKGVGQAITEEDGETAPSSTSSLLLGNSGIVSRTLDTIFVDATTLVSRRLDEVFTRMDITTNTPSSSDKESTSIQPPSPSSVYSNDYPFEDNHDNNNNVFQGTDSESDDWSFLDDIHRAIEAWLDAGGLEMARLGYVPVFRSDLGGRERRHSV